MALKYARERQHLKMLKRRRDRLDAILNDWRGNDPAPVVAEYEAVDWAIRVIETQLADLEAGVV